MQILHLSHLSVFARLSTHFLVLSVFQRFIVLLIDNFYLARDLH